MSKEINFLHPKLKTEVTSSCIAEDDYQPENLVSQDFWSQDRGFMAYNVVKPPVTLTFNFRHPIEVYRVKLWPVSGSQRSTGFEIQVATRDDFVAVAKCTRTNANIVEFNQSVENTSPTSSACSQLKFFSSNFIKRSLKHVSSMRVIITATQRCAAVLKRLEIWGVPSAKLDPAVREDFECMWHKTSAAPKSCPAHQVDSPSTSESSKPSLDAEHIPEEYLDSITYELMLFPMRLPCGKAVDQSTIEKHSQIEEKWGRAASDPFTGKLFTANSKPMLDATLKSSIDRFLLQNANRKDVKTLPRTLGRKPNAEGAVKRERNCSSYVESAKRLKSEDVVESPRLQLSVIPIDEAMQSALSAIRKRSTVHNVHEGEKRNNVCFSCQSNHFLYKIKSCDHLICRICLNKVRTLLVCTCSRPFLSSDVERIFQ